MAFDLEAVRSQFPALAETDAGVPRVYLDNPAGTQVPRSVVERMSECMLTANANLGGHFKTSQLAGDIAADAQAAMADFLNAPSPDEIIFGQNMTSLTFHVSRSIGRHFESGDEIVLSRMDHDANVEPWVLMARDHGLTVRWLAFDTESFEFDLSKLDDVLNDKTRLVCVGGASNLTGTINDIRTICRKVRDAGAWSFIDAVQSVPHVVTDVQAIDCDFLACSAYKFFGPHQGILWGRSDVLESLEPYKVRPAPATIPWSFAPGTASHEGMAGTAAAVDYFAWIGRSMAGAAADRGPAIRAAMQLLFDYEHELSDHLVRGLNSLPGITVQGITDPDRMQWRVPTVSFTHSSLAPDEIASALADRSIFVWSGHNYAVEAAQALGILESGGAVRIGPVHYNSIAEIDTLLDALATTIG
jgi:cysteine desulfurase family protein (TIGR01976 family)